MYLLPLLLLDLGFFVRLAAAVIPAVFLMIYVYRKDTVEKEPRGLLITLALAGVGAAALSVGLETLLGKLLDATMLSPDSTAYAVVMAFVVVAVSEEGTKLILLKLRSWRHPAFNYRFDGIVYAVFVSLGFAAIENVLYVSQYGISVALPRALLAIPGHAAFAVVMGIFYGRAKLFSLHGMEEEERKNKRLAFLVPVLMHGFYDACLMVSSTFAVVIFLIFVAVMYTYIFRLVKRESLTDEPFEVGGGYFHG